MKTPQLKTSIVHFAGLLLAAVVVFTNAALAETSGTTAIRPGATIDGLRMEARARLVDGKEGKLLVIHAILINEGSQDLTVLTKELGPSMSRDAKGLTIGFDFTGRQKLNGRLMIPSLYPHEPVTLRPGEATMLLARLSSKSKVEPLKDGEVIRVGYFVWDGWGERFDLWHGYVCVQVHVEIAPSK